MKIVLKSAMNRIISLKRLQADVIFHHANSITITKLSSATNEITETKMKSALDRICRLR